MKDQTVGGCEISSAEMAVIMIVLSETQKILSAIFYYRQVDKFSVLFTPTYANLKAVAMFFFSVLGILI